MPDTSIPSDDRVSNLLHRAQELQITLSTDPIHETFEDLCEIVQSCRLGELTRHPILEKLYTEIFNPLIKKEFGSVEKYLKSLLNFKTTSPSNSSSSSSSEEEEEEEEWWTCPEEVVKDLEGEEKGRKEERRGGKSDYRVRKNDWGYSIPSNVQHYVVWVNKPLFHRKLCTDSSQGGQLDQAEEDSISTANKNKTRSIDPIKRRSRKKSTSSRNDWNFAKEFGLSGLTGLNCSEMRIIKQLQKEHVGSNPQLEEEEELEEVENEESTAGREIEKFVKTYWKVENGFQTAW
ncbi:hypothetical protein JCM3765_001546 [Sporobolomyces pararoseus]